MKPSCPECHRVGRSVGHITLESLLLPRARAELRSDEEYRFCATHGCSTVYYPTTDPGKRRFSTADLRVRVGQKRPGPPTPVCYCFHHTEEEIAQQFRATGTCDLVERIEARIRAGECRCELENPQGSCCLGDVRAAVARRGQPRSLASPGGGPPGGLGEEGGPRIERSSVEDSARPQGNEPRA